MNTRQNIIIGLLTILIILIGFAVYVFGFRNTHTALDTTDWTKPATLNTDVPVVPNPVQQNQNPAILNLKTYTNTQYGFQMQYPGAFTTQETNDGGFYNEYPIFTAEFTAPSDYQKGTDFGPGRITLSVSSYTDKCYMSDGGTVRNMNTAKVINGRTFYSDPAYHGEGDAMGGQEGTGSLYATIANGKCYRVLTLIGWRDLHGFVDEPYTYPPHFDEQKVNQDFDTVISTLMIK